MGGVLCKRGTSVRSEIDDQKKNHTAELTSFQSSWQAACQDDPDFESHEVAIHGRITKILQTISTGAETRSIPIEAFMEVTDFLRETDHDVMKFILEYRRDISENKELFDLVDDYFKNSLKTLNFCSVLGNCLKSAYNSQLMIKLAVKHFEEEMNKEGNANYEKSLEELRRFKEAGDPFTDKFVTLFQSVHQQQEAMLKKLTKQKKKLDKKLKRLKTWKKVSNVIFIAAFSSVLIFSVVAAAVAAPAVIIALAAALTVPMGSIGKCSNMLWNRYINEKKKKSELIVHMNNCSPCLLKDLETIGPLVCKLEHVIKSILWDADFALQDENSVTIMLGDVKKQLELFSAAIDELNTRSVRCTEFVTGARAEILKKIVTPNLK